MGGESFKSTNCKSVFLFSVCGGRGLRPFVGEGKASWQEPGAQGKGLSLQVGEGAVPLGMEAEVP